MIHQRLTVRLLCGILFCGVMAGCSDSKSPTQPGSSPTTPTAPQVVDRTFTLAPNETASVHEGALELTFNRVVKDERCPGDAICLADAITEAQLEFDLTQRSGSGQARQSKLHLSTTTMKTMKVGIYTLSLEQLAPYPFGSQPAIQPDAWRANVRITSALD